MEKSVLLKEDSDYLHFPRKESMPPPGQAFLVAAVVQSLSRVWLFVTPCNSSTPGFPVLHYLLNFAQTHVHWVGDAIKPSHPLSPPSPPALNLSQHQGLFQWVSSSHQVGQRIGAFSFNISPSNEHPGLISLRTDCLDLFAVQGTLKSLLQHHSTKASILWHSAFFIVQLSHLYMTTGKNHSFDYMDLCWQSDVSAF